MKTTILSAVLLASAAFAKPQPGLPFLLIWPTARSTALAGAMTGLADDPDAAFFNPAGLAFQEGLGATAEYGTWLPGLFPGMCQAYLAGRYRIPGTRVAAGLDAQFFDPEYVDIMDHLSPPDPLVWRGAIGAFLGLQATRNVGIGVKAKYIHSENVPSWVWKVMPELGIEAGGTGTTWAADVGALWKPTPEFSLGGSVANLGPGISYPSSDEHDPSPAILRLGACWTPVNDRRVRVNVLPEFDKVLVGMFFDSADTKTFGEELQTELRDVWKALAIEVTGYEILTIRLGYFEDRTWQRGGLVFKNRHGETYHYALYDLLTWKNLGKLESVGLCWGFGIGYKDYFRIDVSSDAAIYDFPTKNWKLSLVANDIVGGIREFRQGHVPWEE
jgi:hypothetical protein